jgi:hypothetical protein
MTDAIDFLIGQMRVLTTREENLFCVASSPTEMSGLDQELDRLMPELEAAKAAAGIGQVGPVVIRYFPTGIPDNYVMEVGVPVRAGTPAAAQHRSRRCRRTFALRYSIGGVWNTLGRPTRR